MKKLSKKKIIATSLLGISLFVLPTLISSCVRVDDQIKAKQKEEKEQLEKLSTKIFLINEENFDYDVIEISKTNIENVDQDFVLNHIFINKESLDLRSNQRIDVRLHDKDLYYPALFLELKLYVNDELKETTINRVKFPFAPKQYEPQKDIIEFTNNFHASNELRLANATQTVGLTFVNKTTNNFIFGNGTWFDYKISEDESYPLTWYIATNSHVAFANKNKDNYGNYLVANEQEQTEFYLSNINTIDLKINQYNTDDWENHDISNIDVSNKKQTFKINNPKTIFAGDNYLKTKPNDLNQNIDKDIEEIADLAIIEISFEDAQTARLATNNIYERAKHDWNLYTFDLRKNNQPYYLINYHQPLYDERTSAKFNFIYAWGQDFEKYRYYKESTNVSAIGLNKQMVLDNDSNKINTINNNISFLTLNYDYYNDKETSIVPIEQNFKNISFVDTSWFADPLIAYEYDYIKFDNKTKFKSQGLIYSLAYGNLREGSSGIVNNMHSSYLGWMGINFGSFDNNSSLGLFYFIGDKYDLEQYNIYSKDKYPNYELVKYDLIYYHPTKNNIEYPKQNKSYLSELLRIHGEDYKTHRTMVFNNESKDIRIIKNNK